MTALSRFLDRHGLDGQFREKATRLGDRVAVGTAVGIVAALAALSPIKAHSQDFDPARDTPIGGAGMAQRMAMLADRTDDRMEDMRQLDVAIHTWDQFKDPHSSMNLKLTTLIRAKEILASKTPHPELSKFDFTLVNVPENLSEGASMEYVADSINAKKDFLIQAATALDSYGNAIRQGNHDREIAAAAKLDAVISKYEQVKPHLDENLRNALREMTSSSGWTGDTANLR